MAKSKARTLAIRQQAQPINVVDSALTIEQVVKQRELITSLMSKAMKADEHYGKIPGCGDKPTLLQPGAQLLAHMFRLRPEYEIIEKDLPNNHKRFRITCRMFFIGARPEIRIGEGVGECSSMETKYRFRNAAMEIEETGEPLPHGFWQWRETMGEAAARKKLGEAFDGKNVGPKKIQGTWQVVIYKGGGEGKIENPNPADTFNTVLKIAKKRAFVDATITATASSDFFTQDLEDIRENQSAAGESPIPKQEKKANAREVKSKGAKLEELASTLHFDNVKPEDFMASAKEKGAIPSNKMTFEQLPEALAGTLLERYKEIAADLIDAMPA
jgi:hypothetical protein